MSLLTLLLTRDAEAKRMLERLLQELGIAVLATEESDETAELLERRKFEGVIVDCDDVPGSRALLHGLRRGKSNRTAVVFALASKATSLRELYDLGANFVLTKPLAANTIQRCFRAARPLLARERRRYYRCPVETSVAVDLGNAPTRTFASVNVSEGGVSLQAPQGLPIGAPVRVTFSLPDVSTAITAKGEVAWVEDNGHVGLQLNEMSTAHRVALCLWVVRNLEMAEALPVTTTMPPEPRISLTAS